LTWGVERSEIKIVHPPSLFSFVCEVAVESAVVEAVLSYVLLLSCIVAFSPQALSADGKFVRLLFLPLSLSSGDFNFYSTIVLSLLVFCPSLFSFKVLRHGPMKAHFFFFSPPTLLIASKEMPLSLGDLSFFFDPLALSRKEVYCDPQLLPS